MRLLSIDSKGAGFFEKLLNPSKGSKGAKQKCIENHFLEIPTGEGKSIILGITACIFALQGWQVDCVCYSKYLSTRDESDFQEIFDVLKLVSNDIGRIRYMTFADLCESHIEGIRDNVESLIHGKQTKDCSDPSEKKRVLLIDEADVFFTKRFYGNRHSPGILLQSTEINSLIKHIWTNRLTWTAHDQILQTSEYLEVVTRFSGIEKLIEISALSMVKNVQDINNPRFEWVLNKDGKLGYVVAGDFIPASKFRHQNRTVFAFLAEKEKGNPHVTEKDLDGMLGIDIKCGDFSYAALPTRYYSLIFGVSGTLTTLLDEEKSLLNSEYKITKNSVIPSAYGTKRGRLDFMFENQLHVMILDNESEWQARIEKEIADAAAVSRPVLVCFKNDRALQCFVSARPKHEHAKRLDANLDESDLDYINGIVENATVPGNVTLLTRKYGRGLDFKPSKESCDKGGVLVIQTFFSSSESEEIQIMGRTARQGEKGAYRLIMCSEHLKDKFGFVYSDKMQSASLKSLLGEARAQKMKGKFDARAKKKLEADKADSKSWHFANSLYGPGTAAEKLDLLVSFSLAFSVKPTTFILMLDVSGSMKNHYNTLMDAFKAFTSALIEHGHGEGTLLTVITFDHKAETLFRDHPVTRVQPLPTKMPGGGATSFSEAFKKCHEEISTAIAADSSRTVTLLFMTDGEDETFSADMIEALTEDVGTNIEAYNSIDFGPDGGGGSMKLGDVMSAFRDAGIRTRSIAPSNADELVEAFAAAAGDAALHMR